MALAIRTGIPAGVWAADSLAMWTAARMLGWTEEVPSGG